MPGRKRWGFLIFPSREAPLRAALEASCFLGALPPVDLRAVCLVRAMVSYQNVCEESCVKAVFIYSQSQGIFLTWNNLFSVEDQKYLC